MKNILRLNIILIVAYLSALAAAKWLSFPYMANVLGAIIFFLPGLNLALALEQLTAHMGRAKLALWAFLFSLLVTPTFIFYMPMGSRVVAQEKEILLSFFLLTFLFLAIFLFSFLLKKREITVVKIPSFKKYTSFWLAVLIFALLLGAHFLIYPFIPEGDGYSYIHVIEKTIDTGKFFSLDNRSIFYSLVWSMHHLTQVPAYWLFKLVFPFLGIGMIIASYKASADLGVSKRMTILTSLSFFFFPVVLQAMLTFRPQFIFLLAFPIAMLLLLDALREKNNWNITLLLLLAIIGIRMHQSFIFLILGIAPVIIYLVGKRFRARGVAIFIFLLVIILMIFRKSLLDFQSYILILYYSFPKLDFSWWFLDDYTTHYGERVTWPGITWIFYYGNNLGLVFPFLGALLVWQKTKIANFFKDFWPLVSIIAVLLFFAEIFPRLGVFYEPNRFMLFFAAILALFVPLLVKNLEDKINRKFLWFAVAILALATFVSSMALTHSKQGMVDWNEYQATSFIRENTPENAIFVTAKSSGTLFGYFYHRSIISPSRQFFLEDDKAKDRFILENLENMPRYQSFLKTQNKKAADDAAFSAVYAQDVPQFPEGIAREIPRRPIYVFYSKNKEKGIRKNRPWWQDANFFGANLAKFDDAERYEKVYDKGGVLVWKIRGL